MDGGWVFCFGPRGETEVFEKSHCLCFSSVWMAAQINSCFSQFCCYCHSSSWLLQKQTRQSSFVRHKNFRHATVGFILLPARLERQHMHDSLDDTILFWVGLNGARWASLSIRLMSDLALAGRTVIRRAWHFWFYRESLILLNEESALKNRCSVVRRRREVTGVNLYCLWQQQILKPDVGSTEML